MMALRTPIGMHVTAQAERILVRIFAAALAHDSSRLLIEEDLISAGVRIACNPGLMSAAPMSLGIIAAVAGGGGAGAGTEVLDCRTRRRQNLRAARGRLDSRKRGVRKHQRERDSEENRKYARERCVTPRPAISWRRVSHVGKREATRAGCQVTGANVCMRAITHFDMSALFDGGRYAWESRTRRGRSGRSDWEGGTEYSGNVLVHAELPLNQQLQIIAVVLIELALVAPYDRACFIQKHQRRIGDNSELRLHGAIVAADELTVVDLQPLDDGVDANGLFARRAASFIGDADDFELGFVARLQFDELRHRLAAGHAPRRPEIEQHELALALGLIVPRFARGVIEREVVKLAAYEYARRHACRRGQARRWGPRLCGGRRHVDLRRNRRRCDRRRRRWAVQRDRPLNLDRRLLVGNLQHRRPVRLVG